MAKVSGSAKKAGKRESKESSPRSVAEGGGAECTAASQPETPECATGDLLKPNGVLPGMECANREWIKEPVDLLDALGGVKANREALIKRFNEISFGCAVEGGLKKNNERLEKIALAITVLGELEAAFTV